MLCMQHVLCLQAHSASVCRPSCSCTSFVHLTDRADRVVAQLQGAGKKLSAIPAYMQQQSGMGNSVIHEQPTTREDSSMRIV